MRLDFGGGLQIGAVGDANLTSDDRRAIEPLAAALIGQDEMAETANAIRSTGLNRRVQTPKPRSTAFFRPSLANDRAVDDPDRASAAPLQHSRSARFVAREKLRHQRLKPAVAFAKPLQQGDVAEPRQTARGRPGRGAPQAQAARPVGQTQPQKILRRANPASAPKRPESPRCAVQMFGAAQLVHDAQPVVIVQHRRSHPQRESLPKQECKP